MSATSKKGLVIGILAGVVFLFGGVLTVSAVPGPTGPAAPAAVARVAADVAARAAPVDPDGISAGADALFKNAKCAYLCTNMIPLFLAYVLFIATAGILVLAGYIFNAILFLGITKDFINQPFVGELWIIVRDFSNMAFIFVLLYAGIQTMLGFPGWQKAVRNVVIIALLINFSLFFTKVVIDAGNVLAVGIYSSMGAESKNAYATSGSTKERDLSGVIATAISPEKFLAGTEKTTSAFVISVIFIIGAITNLLVAWALFRVAIVFVGRIIGFWFLMIISPFAFISLTVPKLESNFHDWLKNLLGLAFVAPVFLFFLYIIIRVLNSGVIGKAINVPPTTEFSFTMFLVPVLMVLMIYMALDKAVEYSKKMAGGFGTLGATLAGGALGIAAVGAVAGVGALKVASSGLQKVGSYGKNADGTDKAGGLARVARWTGTAGNYGAQGAHVFRNTTFDPRNLPGASHLGIGAGTQQTTGKWKDSLNKSSEQFAADRDANTTAGRIRLETETRDKKEKAQNARAAGQTPEARAEAALLATESADAATTAGRAAAVTAISEANTKKAEAERAKRDAEKTPEAIAEALIQSAAIASSATEAGRTAAVAKINAAAIKNRKNKAARVPEIEKKVAKLNKAMEDLSAAYNNNTGDALLADLDAALRSAETNARVAEENAVRDPNNGQAQVDYLRAKRDRESAEKDHKKATSATEDLEKMEKQLAEYKEQN